VYRALTRCPGALGVRRQPVGDGDDEGVPAGAEPLRPGGGVEQHVVADLGDADSDGWASERTSPSPGTSTVSSSASRHDFPVAVTRPRRQRMRDTGTEMLMQRG
jgi:hypothetical protein